MKKPTRIELFELSFVLQQTEYFTLNIKKRKLLTLKPEIKMFQILILSH